MQPERPNPLQAAAGHLPRRACSAQPAAAGCLQLKAPATEPPADISQGEDRNGPAGCLRLTREPPADMFQGEDWKGPAACLQLKAPATQPPADMFQGDNQQEPGRLEHLSCVYEGPSTLASGVDGTH